MESAQCYLGLGLILGIMIAGLYGFGEHQRRTAMQLIHAFPKELAKAKETKQRAIENRRKGQQALPLAFLLMALSLAVLAFALILLFRNLGS